ncbi:MAG: hypothetical protein ACI4T4_05135 [Limosilactobacillus sp.]
MDLEKLILELQSRVLYLGEKVDRLNSRIDELEAAEEEASAAGSNQATAARKTKIKGKISKNELVDGVKKALAGQIPANHIRKGTRREGSGLIISSGEHQIKICLRGSGYYGKEDVSERMQYTGFSTINEATIMDEDGRMNYDFFVFGINHSDEPGQPHLEFFVFDQKQFKNLLEEKKANGANRVYYFYFGETTDGHYIDDRERDKTVLVDDEHADWDALVQQYKEIG